MGLRRNDLNMMLNNVVSIDEYESKLDDSAIVVAFYVTDRHAAEDANRFIQKSYADILDSEISAAPDHEGNYMIFVELYLNDKAAKQISNLCYDLTSLGGFDHWIVRVRGSKPTQPIESKEIEGVIKSLIQKNIKEFFNQSEVQDVILENTLCIKTPFHELKGRIVDFGSFDRIVARHSLQESAIDTRNATRKSCSMMETVLGTGWHVDSLNSMYAIYNDSSDSLLLLAR